MTPIFKKLWPRRTLEIALAVCGVIGAWFYGLRVAQDGLAAIDRPILACADLLPPWYGSREVLFARDNPYSAEVTTRIQIAFYGYKATSTMDQQRFAYPAFSAFLFAPFAVLSFAAAEKLAFAVFLGMTVFAVRWWAGSALTTHQWILAVLLVSASFPFYYAMHGRQPTLLFAGILAAAFAAAQSDRLVLCGALLALAAGKPQLAMPVLLPVLAWVCAEPRARRALPIAFASCLAALVIASEILSPGWVGGWLGVLRDYPHYASVTPLIQHVAGARAGVLLSAVLICAVLYAAWRFRQDLGFTVALSIAAFTLVIPFHFYDEVVLLGPLCWLAAHRAQFTNWTSRMLLAAVVVSLAEGWILSAAMSLLYLVNHAAAVAMWEIPLALTGLLPFAVFLTLGHQAVMRMRAAPRPDASPLIKAAQSGG